MYSQKEGMFETKSSTVILRSSMLHGGNTTCNVTLALHGSLLQMQERYYVSDFFQ